MTSKSAANTLICRGQEKLTLPILYRSSILRLVFNAGAVPFSDSGQQYTAGSVVLPPPGSYSSAGPPVAPGVLGMPDLTYNPMTDMRTPAPVPLSSLPVNFSSPMQPPLYQPSPLPVGTMYGTKAPPGDPNSGIGGPLPPPPPTGGFVPSHGIVTATPGKVSYRVM